MPDKFPQPGTALSAPRAPVSASVTATAIVSVASSASTTLPSSLQPQQPQPTAGAVSLVDPVVAFIDKTGEVASAPTPTPSPLAVESVGRVVDHGAVKRGPSDPRLGGDVKRAKQATDTTATTAEPTAYFSHIPTTLPFISSCPHLLFDSVADGEAQKQIGNELLERLSDVLGDSAVFAGVRDLRDNQRTRDREMLYRWQELVGMQMKEGSELFARHVALEMQHGFSDPRGLIALKTQHLEQRREFSNRCQMSQQQFIEICAMDRANALKAQQISLENMKIPEMLVTVDAEVISLQRAIVGLILEAEKLWPGRLIGSGETAKTLLPPVTLLHVALAVVVVSAVVAAAMVVKTRGGLVTGVVMVIIAAEIVTHVVVEAARINGTSSHHNQVLLLLLPLLPLLSSIHVMITLDNRLHLDRKNCSKCQCMTTGRSGCRHLRNSSRLVNSSNSHRTVRQMHHLMMNMEADRAPCQSNQVTHRNLRVLTLLGRKMVLVIVEMAIAL
ncbi:Hypothetical protein PHPALM_4467 [Phytophthora palmivora]|uniref:Uncharacterized protein n=1 Tax=Phytophthora palmivora TaxID=4796 RepID=A0A2P4YJS1_9STRA|nr:Hypothetical protein PHPALM_4467 [Phytophthora palmivora]